MFPEQTGAIFSWPCLTHCEFVLSHQLSMKSLNGGPGAFRCYHCYVAQTLWLLRSAINYDIHLCDIAVNGK